MGGGWQVRQPGGCAAGDPAKEYLENRVGAYGKPSSSRYYIFYHFLIAKLIIILNLFV
jgi:hypothetical protein